MVGGGVAFGEAIGAGRPDGPRSSSASAGTLHQKERFRARRGLREIDEARDPDAGRGGADSTTVSSYDQYRTNEVHFQVFIAKTLPREVTVIGQGERARISRPGSHSTNGL